MVFILIVLLLAISSFFYYQDTSNKKSPSKTSLTEQQERLQTLISSGKYWGLYINYKSEALCCKAVLSLNKKHFPINNIPALPLEGCTQRACHCTHAGLVEKRKKNSQRRASTERRDMIRFEEASNRRSHSDRRLDNWANRNA